MIALVLVLTFIVLLLGLLVAGLLRSHADILKALHDLGAGVGDPVRVGPGGADPAGTAAPLPLRAPVTMGPTLPRERNATSAPDISGRAPSGDAVAVSFAGHDQLTLVAFLSSGCATCAGFWDALPRAADFGLPEAIRLVVVTKGPELEIPAEVQVRMVKGLSVIMSTEAWVDYEVPGSPFFVLIDGSRSRRIGEGVANQFSQVVELVRRAQSDTQSFSVGPLPGTAAGLDGPARESMNDQALLAVGIGPGHPSLYPTSLDQVFPDQGGVSGARGSDTMLEPASRPESAG